MTAELEVVRAGFLGSLAAGMCTGIGALIVFAIRRLSTRIEVLMLASAAGIMLAATFFSLLAPALDMAASLMNGKAAAAAVVVGGLLLGAGGLLALHRLLPHEHFFTGHEGADSRSLSRMWLFVIAIALHNFPEGMAVGVGFAGSDAAHGLSLAAGIGIQNIPEGLAVAAALLSVGYGRGRAFGVAFLTGLIEPLGGLFGSAAVWLAQPMMPWVLGMTAGAMLFVICDEIIPETWRKGYETLATIALVIGFALMMFLDVVLG